MTKVTAQDLAFAGIILDAAKMAPAEARKKVAQVLAAIHERAVLCASVRLEREYGLVQRALPVPSNTVANSPSVSKRSEGDEG